MAAKRVNYSEITDDIRHLTDLCRDNSNIDPELYIKTPNVSRAKTVIESSENV